MSNLNSAFISEINDLLNGFQNPVVLIDRNYKIITTNLAYQLQHECESPEDQYCYKVSHQYGKPCHDMGEECPLVSCLQNNKPVRVLHQHYTPDGNIHVDIGMFPIHNRDGEIVAFMETVKGIKDSSSGNHSLIGKSKPFKRLLELISRVATSDTAALLLGESGTGKELVAHAIHSSSQRAKGPFVPVDCSGLTESLFESELFGHERGAFTGALHHKTGLVEAAHGGTLFLDEIGDVPLNLQVKLLRLLETNTFRTVGGIETKHAEFRLICATHKNLVKMVETGEFRRDLYYRISAFPIELPSLKERAKDIPLLADGLLKRINPHKRINISKEAITILEEYSFPGNIRELRNILERALILSDSHSIEPEHLPLLNSSSLQTVNETPFNHVMPLDQLEIAYLKWASQQYNGDRKSLAKALGVSERTLYRKLEKVEKLNS